MSNFESETGDPVAGTKETSVAKRNGEKKSPGRTLGVTSSNELPRAGEGVLALLQRFGVDESMVNSMMDKWRLQLSDKVSETIREGDLVDLLDRAREMARNSGDKLKSYAQANPAMFYSGVIAIMAGAGLLAAAAKGAEPDDNSDIGL